ncbi:MAG TPA: hypothetical protein VEU96_14455, partial [Bryobacteraceae bacterium]|nr:hypothetical protein [Bryobacteraceae bacterium]
EPPSPVEQAAAPTETPVDTTPAVAAPVVASTEAPGPVEQIAAPTETPVDTTLAVTTAVVEPTEAPNPVEQVATPTEAPAMVAAVEPSQPANPVEPVAAPTEASTESLPADVVVSPVEPVVASVETPAESTPVVVAPVESAETASPSETLSAAGIPTELVSATVAAPAVVVAGVTSAEAASPVESAAAATESKAESTPALPVAPPPTASSAPAVDPSVVAPIVEAPPVDTLAASPTVEAVQENSEPLPCNAPQATASPAESAQAAPSAATVELPLEPAPQPVAEPATRVGEALELQAEAILDAIARQIEIHQSGIRAIVRSFQQAPVSSLLTAPRQLLEAPAPAAEQWQRTPKPSIPAQKQAAFRHSGLTTGFQSSTLAGPCLPPELRTFIEDRTLAPRRARRKAGIPAWTVSVVVAMALFLGAGSLIQFFTGNRDAKAAAPATPRTQASTTASTPSVREQHPFARYIEVTGLRVVADLNHRSQVQYVVVNHSSAQLSDLMVRIAVRSATESASAPPLFTVSAVVPSLGPYQSKEIRTDLDSELRSSAIPDWENLRTEVQVGAQQ